MSMDFNIANMLYGLHKYSVDGWRSTSDMEGSWTGLKGQYQERAFGLCEDYLDCGFVLLLDRLFCFTVFELFSVQGYCVLPACIWGIVTKKCMTRFCGRTWSCTMWTTLEAFWSICYKACWSLNHQKGLQRRMHWSTLSLKSPIVDCKTFAACCFCNSWVAWPQLAGVWELITIIRSWAAHLWRTLKELSYLYWKKLQNICCSEAEWKGRSSPPRNGQAWIKR